jgi:hypothetical protein
MRRAGLCRTDHAWLQVVMNGRLLLLDDATAPFPRHVLLLDSGAPPK